MNHLTPDELIDAVEGMLVPERHAHLASHERQEAFHVPIFFTIRVRQTDIDDLSPAFGLRATYLCGLLILFSTNQVAESFGAYDVRTLANNDRPALCLQR